MFLLLVVCGVAEGGARRTKAWANACAASGRPRKPPRAWGVDRPHHAQRKRGSVGARRAWGGVQEEQMRNRHIAAGALSRIEMPPRQRLLEKRTHFKFSSSCPHAHPPPPTTTQTLGVHAPPALPLLLVLNSPFSFFYPPRLWHTPTQEKKLHSNRPPLHPYDAAAPFCCGAGHPGHPGRRIGR